MIAQSKPNNLSPEEYLLFEESSQEKHEYINGQVYAMAGANSNHVTICINLVTMLRDHVRGLGCQIFMSDMKVRIEEKNCYYYPDIFVTCNNQDRDNNTYKQFPKLIIEVLSDSTEAFDRGNKFYDYSTLESLEEYILINSNKQQLDCFRKVKDHRWEIYFYRDNDFRIDSINFTSNIMKIYEDTELLF
ncbi:Uma2 family endonuclease [Thermosynechococcaceae cyanobacterium BACA0444]|uniref:Uma2 family endonuclease n=1 Tax=Pseudocalidococcus azoricus BACA0444 TaxID=2918990 RepID=A0AAE4JXJ7_9CYAN|nr:Uma2 family endonuclease [Pseudocalidococcus azoricus]MDS3862316.1 Uma2 family endonuclease [Pseudocalidococcus azoricus BACA0444]